MGIQSFSVGDPPYANGNDLSYTITTTTAADSSTVYYPGAAGGTNWDYKIVDPDNYGFKVDGSVKFGGKNTNKINWDLSRFTLIERLKFLYNLLFKGKATMEVDPKLIKLEKALEVLRNAK